MEDRSNQYSFDEIHIGKMKPNGNSLRTREIRRPDGLEQLSWYNLAASICKILNERVK